MTPRTTAAAFAVALASIACGSTPTTPILRPRLGVTRILAFGDSLTDGGATPSGFHTVFVHPTDDPGVAKGYPYKLLTLLSERYADQPIQVYNGGYGGRSAADDALGKPDRTLAEFLDAFQPDLMILMHGANDLNQGAAPNVDTIAGYVGLLTAQAQAHGTAVIVSSLPPRIPGGSPNRAQNPEFVAPYNAALAAMAASRGAPYVDVYSPMIANLAGPDIAPDGLHLTEAGNDKLAALYFAMLQRLYEINR
jgi:lysophospholipase L1-like esterase